METFKEEILEKLTIDGRAIFDSWVAGFKTRPSTKSLWEKLTYVQYVIFFDLVRMFFNSIGVGTEDWTLEFVRYKPDLSNTLYLNLILQTVSKMSNVPSSINSCWLSNNYDGGGYVYAHTSETISGVRTEFKEKSLRLFYSLCSRPCFTSKDNREADHRCNRTNCFNPRHGRSVTSTENKNHCKFGCQHYCPHEPACIWTRPNDGSLCLHRNDPNRAYQKSDCNCQPSCFSVECEGGNPSKPRKPRK